MISKKHNAVKIGLIVGGGTGDELARVFKDSLERITGILDKRVEIVECPHHFRTYREIQNFTPEEIAETVRIDLKALLSFYKDFYDSGGRVLFRTAINAETLYKLRQVGKAVKTINIQLEKKNLLIVRDEMQGFYTSDNYELKENEVHFSASLSSRNLRMIMSFALEEGKNVLKTPFEVWVVYKHHLFANLIETWSREAFRESKVYQPNHATDLLFQYFRSVDGNDLLMVAGNETGDILHEVLIFHLGIGTRYTLCARNVYLNCGFKGLVEYQTVHGSADDITGKAIVNPLSTLRSIGMIVEDCLHEVEFSKCMENALSEVSKRKVITPDMNGQSSTNEVVDCALNHIAVQYGVA